MIPPKIIKDLGVTITGMVKNERDLMEVEVRHNNVTKAFRTLKKKLQKDGLFRELRMRKYFEKPSLKRARKKKEGIRRVAKEQREKLKREE